MLSDIEALKKPNRWKKLKRGVKKGFKTILLTLDDKIITS